MRQRQVTVLPEALKFRRKQLKLSQGDLGERAGCSEQLIGLIESGKRQPGLSNAMAIAEALEIPLRAIALVHIAVDGHDADALIAEPEKPLADRIRVAVLDVLREAGVDVANGKAEAVAS